MKEQSTTPMGKSEVNALEYLGLKTDLAEKFFSAHKAREEYFKLRLKSSRVPEVKNFLKSTADTLLGDSQGLEVFAESLEPQDIFYKDVSEILRQKIKKDWREIKPFQLASLVKLYSDPISEATGNLAKSLLTNYFKGEQTMEESVMSRYNFVSGVLDLDLDKDFRAVESGTRIVDFITNILPPTSKVYGHCFIATFVIHNNDDLLQRAIITHDILRYLIKKYKFSFKITDEQETKIQRATDKALEQGRKFGQKTVKDLGKDAVLQRKNSLSDYYNREIPLSYYISPPQDPKKMLWPWNIALDRDDPLIQKFIKVLSSNPQNL